MIREYQKGVAKLDRLYGLLLKEDLDDYIKSLLAAHICVLMSGILENVIKENLTDFSDKRAHINVSRFVKRRISEFQNPKTDKIEKLFDAFDILWLEKLSDFWKDNEIKGHLNSIVSNRHNIAHGRTSSVTIHQTREWLGSLKKFIEFVERTCM